MEMNKIQLETVNYQGPPPDYAAAINYNGPPPQGYSQYPPPQQPTAPYQAHSQYPPPQQPTVPYQAPGFQASGPAPSQWYMGAPGAGFELFDGQQEVVVERMVDMMEAVLAVTTGQLKRQFRVMTKDRQQLFFLEEDESLLSNTEQRAYHFTAKNSHGQAVFEVSRDTEHCPCCYCCVQSDACRSESKIVDSIKKDTIGTLSQRFHCCQISFALLDSELSEVMKISSGNACCSPPSTYQLSIPYTDSRGTINKLGSPIGMAVNTYVIRFPPNIDGKMKACCIGIVIHFDFRFHLIHQRRHND